MGNKKYNNPLSADLAMLAGKMQQAINRVNVANDFELTKEVAMRMQEMSLKAEEIDQMISEIFTYAKKKKGKR